MGLYRSLALTLVLVHPSTAGPGQDLAEICKGTEGTADCNKNFAIPHGSQPLTACGNKPSPCGVDILTTSENICDMINDVLPNTDFVDDYDTWCRVIPQAGKDIKTQAALWVNGKLTGAATKDINTAVAIQDQLIHQGFPVKNNKASVISKELVNKDGWTVVKAPEITTTMHASLIRLIDACMSSTCKKWQYEAMRVWFIDWITHDTEIRKGALATMINGWETDFKGPYKTKIAAIYKASSLVQSRQSTVYQKYNQISDRVCVDRACKGKTATKYLKQVVAALDKIGELSDIPYVADGMETTRNMILRDFITVLRQSYGLEPKKLAPPNVLDLAYSHYLNSLRGVMNGFGTLTTDLPYYTDQMNLYLPDFAQAKSGATRVKAVSAAIDALLLPDWKKNKELSATPELRTVRDGFIQIQGLFKTSLQDPVADTITALNAFTTETDKMPLMKKKFKMEFGAVPFDRWVDVQFDYPCRETKKKTFTEAGFSKVHTWPVFTACSFTSQRVDLIKNWIPFLKYRFV
ncbi:hypothetical protein ACJ41O_010413 [Fusarium nematophilum]